MFKFNVISKTLELATHFFMPPRYYLDTLVFGGVFDAEFEVESRRIFELVKFGEVICILSEVTQGELADAPKRVRHFVQSIMGYFIEEIPLTDESILLAELKL